MRAPLLFSLLASLLLTRLLPADDWPVFQQNNQRNAKTSERLPANRLVPNWTWRSPGAPQPAWSGPAKWDAYAGLRGLKSMRNYDPVFHLIAVGDRVWFGSSVDDAVHCLDARSGRELWVYHTDGPVRTPPAYWEGHLYFGSDDGHAYCLTTEGQLAWKFEAHAGARKIVNNGRFVSAWPIRTGVLIEDGRAYFGASLLPWQESYLCAVDARKGTIEGPELYVRRIEEATMEGPMAAFPGRALVSPQGRIPPRLFALRDGRPLGSLKGGGGSFVVLTKDSVFHGPGNKTGWLTTSSMDSLETVASFKNGNAMVVAGDVSFILTDDTLTASNYVNQEVEWTADCDCPLALILAGDTLFAGGQDQVVAFDARDGRKIGSHTVDGKAYGLVVAQGRLLASTDTGSIHAFRVGKPASTTTTTASPQPPSADEQAATASELPAIEPVEDKDLVSRWVFQRPQVSGQSVKDLMEKVHLKVGGRCRLETVGPWQALRLDGHSVELTPQSAPDPTALPVRALSAEAWVRVDQPLRWGGIVGMIEDNGDYEKGWLLGYQDQRFSFAVASREGSGRLTYLAAEHEFTVGQWHHVVGSYDGKTMQLFVDGRPAGSSTAEAGDLDYPPQGRFVLGSYRDQNEHYPMNGQLHEVRVYRRALEDRDCLAHFQAKRQDIPAAESVEAAGDRLAVGPWWQFTSPETALVRWRTETPSPTRLTQFYQGEVVHQAAHDSVRLEHQVQLQDLQHNVQYELQIEFLDQGQQRKTAKYECDTFFNYSVPKVESLRHDLGEQEIQLARRAAQQILKRSGSTTGLCLCLGCHDGELISALIQGSRLRVIAFDTDAERVHSLRQRLQRQGIYGIRATIHRVDSLDHLPITGRVANLVVTESLLASDAWSVSPRQVQPLLAPSGTACIGPADSDGALPPAWREQLAAGTGPQGWCVLEGTAIEGSGIWTHIYGTAANSHYGEEQLAGARTAQDLVVQWIGRPGPRYQADRNGRKPPPLAVGGRIFLQGLHRLLALDQYNGSVLWSLEIPEVDRYNMPRDCGNWCADDQAIYVAIHDKCWKIAAADGQLLEVLAVDPTTTADSDFDWGYIARERDLLIGSAVRAGSSWREFWGNEAWYDGASGPVTDKVCSDRLFARGADFGETRWQYEKGAIINSTITIGNGTIYFVEARGDLLQQTAGRRLGGDAFWRDQYLVALDVESGQLQWERPLDTADGTVAFYAAYGGDKLVLVASTQRRYYIYAFAGQTGADLWSGDIAWGKGKADHGSHLSRPAIVGRRLYVRPGVFDLDNGQALPLQIPVGGCGSYAATQKALFFRAGSGQNSAVWDQQAGEYTTWHRLRPDCWLSTIPAGGMLLSPEGGGGCSCGSWLETSVGFIPKRSLTP